MKTSNAPKSKKSLSPASGAGVVQIAIWKENPEVSKWQDIFTHYSENVFYDFSRPLELLGSSGWSSQIRTGSEGGHFVFTPTWQDLPPYEQG